MKYFDFTLPTPAENLACDEALLDLCEQGLEDEILRFWEPKEPSVVVGYANQIAREVDLETCRLRGIPVFRRCSGGGTVVQGAGCLNYSLILRIGDKGSGSTASISATNVFILDRNRTALDSLLNLPVKIEGQTDLAIGGLKFSGNAQRRLKNALIFHGTFLLHFDLALIAQLLPMPSKQPDYRQNRPHAEFLRNLNVSAVEIKNALREAWDAQTTLPGGLADRIRGLTAKYSSSEWNLKF